jgi:hypothetical protein
VLSPMVRRAAGGVDAAECGVESPAEVADAGS